MRGARMRSCGWWFAGLCLGLGALSPALAQKTIVDIYAPDPISLFDPQVYSRSPLGDSLSLILPTYAQRPIDDLAPRPGAQALGMGGAFTARADDALALAWNPAGMARMEKASFCVDGYVRSSTGSASHLPDSIEVEGLGDFSITSYGADLNSRKVFGFAGAAAPLFDLGGAPLVGGVAFRQRAAVAFGQETLVSMALFSAGGSGLPFTLGIDNQEKGSIDALTVGLAYEPIRSPSFSLAAGAAANFLTGRLRSSVTIRAALRNFEEGAASFKSNYKGFSMDGGLRASLLEEKVRLGAWFGLPHTIKVDNSALSYSPLILPDVNEVERVHWEIAGYDLEVPLFWSLGIAVGPFYGVELAADFNERPWSKAEVKHHDPAFAQFDSDYPAPDVSSFHLGAEFPFPLLRGSFDRLGFQVLTELGYHDLPLAMYGVDLSDGQQPHYLGGEGVEGSATSFGFTVQTHADIDFHLGAEFRSYSYDAWFLGEARGPRDRQLAFRDGEYVVMEVERSDTVLRFSSSMRF